MKNNVDVYGIKNVNFSLIEKGDKKWEEMKMQRLNRGFDDSELWSLDATISHFIYPRLKEFVAMEKHGYPSVLNSMEEWDIIFKKILRAFELLNDDEICGVLEPDSPEDKEIQEGLDLFRKWFFHLWD